MSERRYCKEEGNRTMSHLPVSNRAAIGETAVLPVAAPPEVKFWTGARRTVFPKHLLSHDIKNESPMSRRRSIRRSSDYNDDHDAAALFPDHEH